MCGIAGIVGKLEDREGETRIATAMIRRIAHRGPDGEGVAFRELGAVLAHRRLAVIDLTGGAQPMANADRSLWITYNGEIYNYRELRDALRRAGHVFATGSDTEVILALYESEGCDGLRRLRGMFAFALWDERLREVVLLRDPFGIKPLCYARAKDRLVFGSEAKAVLAHPDVAREPDPQAVHDWLNLRFVPGDQTLWRSVRRLRPGHLMRWRAGGEMRMTPFLEVNDASSSAAGSLDAALAASVDRHMVSDVPVGAYLSGGLDSGAIVATAARRGFRPPTFTLGFGDRSDELDGAAETARLLSLPNDRLLLSPEDLSRDYSMALWHMEEPRVNILQGYSLARFASRKVKVVLSGLGGDELFGGYHTHRWFSLLRFASAVPSRGGAARWTRALLRGANAALGPMSDLPLRGLEVVVAAGDPARAWSLLRNVWDDSPTLSREIYGRRAPSDIQPVVRHIAPYFDGRDPLDAVFEVERGIKLADDFLPAEDRVSMAHGLEVRTPFLDLDFAAWAGRVKNRQHVMAGRGKVYYRRELRACGILPDSVLSRRKWGFSIDPLAQYDRMIRRYVEETLTGEALERIAPVGPDYVRKLMALPHGRTLRWHRFFLWMIAGYVDWHRLFITGNGERPEAR